MLVIIGVKIIQGKAIVTGKEIDTGIITGIISLGIVIIAAVKISGA